MRTILIGGTGRCGTNLLKNIFTNHSSVVTLPFEQRFFIDPDGIIDTYSSLKNIWSPFIADKKIKRLEELLKEVSKDNIIHKFIGNIISQFDKKGKFITQKKYIGWELNKHFPNIQIHNKILIDELTDFYFRGVYPGSNSYKFKNKIINNKPSTENLINVFRKYLVGLIQDLLLYHNKEFFVEDNTWNIFFGREFFELLPNSKLINIYREPSSVITSMMKQRWCPNNYLDTKQWYESMIKYWNIVKKDLPKDFYYEVDFKDLVLLPQKTLLNICNFIEIPFEKSLLNIKFDTSKTIPKYNKEGVL